MNVDAETIELLLKVGGQESVELLAKSLENNRELLKDLAERFKRGDIAADEFSRGVKRLGVEIERESELVARLKGETEEFAAAADKVSKSSVNMGRSILEGGRALQDFSQGGIGGVLNNIEGLAAALGGGPGVAGAATALGLAVYFAKPYVEEFWKSLMEGANKVPKAADNVAGLTEKLKDNEKRLDDLRKQQSLSNAELREFNQRTADQIRLETQLEEARERERQKKANREAMAKGLDRPATEEAAENADILQAGLAGRQGRFDVEVDHSIRDNGRQILRQAMDQASRLKGPERESALRVLTLLRRAMGSFAGLKDVEAQAIGGGDESAITAVRKLLPKDSEFRDVFRQASPEGKAEADREQREIEEFGERARRGSASRRKRAAADKRKDDAEFDAATRSADDEMDRIEESQRAKKEASDKARKEKAEADHAAKAAALASDPRTRIKAMGNELEQGVNAEVLRQWENGGKRETPEQLEQIARMAVSEVPNTGGMIAVAVQRAARMAAMQAYQRAQQDMAQALSRQEITSQSFLGGF